MELVIHIGTEKTGSTAIQNYFADNQSANRQRRLWYPSVGGFSNHRMLVTAFARKKDDAWNLFKIESEEDRKRFSEKTRNLFEEEFRSARERGGQLLLSSEHFHSRLFRPEEVSAFAEWIRPQFATTSILVFVREPKFLVESLYSTALRNGSTRSLKDFVKIQADRPHFYNPEIFLKPWIDEFGAESIVVRFYSESKGFNSVDEVLQALSIQAEISARDYRPNQRLSALSRKLLLLSNHLTSRYPLAKGKRWLDLFGLSALAEVPALRRLHLPPALRSFDSQFSQGMLWLERFSSQNHK